MTNSFQKISDAWKLSDNFWMMFYSYKAVDWNIDRRQPGSCFSNLIMKKIPTKIHFST